MSLFQLISSCIVLAFIGLQAPQEPMAFILMLLAGLALLPFILTSLLSWLDQDKHPNLIRFTTLGGVMLLVTSSLFLPGAYEESGWFIMLGCFLFAGLAVLFRKNINKLLLLVNGFGLLVCTAFLLFCLFGFI